MYLVNEKVEGRNTKERKETTLRYIIKQEKGIGKRSEIGKIK